MNEPQGWNSFARANAAQRWRKQSAAMGRHMTESLVAEAQVQPGMRVLDVACGTGEPAISISMLLNGTGSVTGVDISAGPLNMAQSRANQRDLRNIAFALADVHALPFPDHAFDRITCRLGLMFFADPRRALGEMRRALKPGGRASVVVWGPIEQPYFESTVGTIVRLLPGIGSAPAGAVMFKFAQPGMMTAALREAGFQNIQEELRTIDWTWMGSPEEVWAYFQEVTVPFRSLLDAIPQERRAEVDAAVVQAIRGHCKGGQVNFTARAVFASAEAPRA